MKGVIPAYLISRDDPLSAFDTRINVWPFGKNPPDPHLSQAGLGHTRMGYNARPIANWPTNGHPTSNPNDTAYWVPMLEPIDPAFPITAMPKQSKLKNKAILCDIIVSPDNVYKRHKTGINVLYGDASVRYVPLKTFLKPSWMYIPAGDVSVSWNDE